MILLLLSEGVAENWLDLSRPSHEVMLGLKLDLGGRTVGEVGLLENLAIPDNSPDFGIHAGLAVRF